MTKASGGNWTILLVAAAIGVVGAVLWPGDAREAATPSSAVPAPATGLPAVATSGHRAGATAAPQNPANSVPASRLVRNIAAEQAKAALPAPPPDYQPPQPPAPAAVVHPEVTDPETRRRLAPAWAD